MDTEGKDAEKYVSLLHAVKFFNRFDIDDVRKLLTVGTIHHYKLHEYIFKEQDADHSFFVILTGAVKLLKDGPLKQKKELVKIQAGTCFGEMGLLLHEIRTASALATEESYIFRITSDNVQNLSVGIKETLYHQFAILLAERLKETTRSVISPDHF